MADPVTQLCQTRSPKDCICVIECRTPVEKSPQANSNPNVSEIVGTFVWPAIILILLLVYRRHLVSIIERISPRIHKLSLGGFSIELAKGKEASIEYTDPRMDFRHSGQPADVIDSTARMFQEQLAVSTEADYAIVDLGDGKEWLDSRLFIITILLASTRGIRALVFLESAPGVRRKYMGTANTEKILWRFGELYPWMEQAFRNVYGYYRVPWVMEKIDPEKAKNILSNYLGLIQQPGQAFGTFQPMVFPADKGVIISDVGPYPEVREHAAWLDGGRLERVLSNELSTSFVCRSELKGLSDSDQIKMLLKEPDPFVAVTRDDGRFEYLIERTKVMDNVVENFLASEA